MALTEPEATAAERIALLLETLEPHRRPDVLEAAMSLLRDGRGRGRRPSRGGVEVETVQLDKRLRRPAAGGASADRPARRPR